MSELSKSYAPEELEARWYDRWLAGGYFTADAKSDKPPFTIVIPPPNVTGSLHMGHALTNTIQDILARWKRMSGFETLWLPGTDHAGIATQTVVERRLRAEGVDRRELGRDAFLERVWAWKAQSGDRISLQLRRIGSSLDWTRERFTMDEGLSLAVREVFVSLYEQGLIYQDERLVNWDPATQTVLSDLEVENEEEDGFLWHIAYPVVGTDDRLVVATTRPETLLGDTAVAIHPDDPRYTHLHGRSVRLPLTDREIPIICDGVAADMTFGSGAVKITPGHDLNDFETGRRNGLPLLTVLDLEARINEHGGSRYQGLDRYDARARILDDLRAAGLLVREEPYRLSPGRSQRSGVIVEPMSIGKQWYVRMGPLAGPAIDCVRDGRIRFVPSHWEKTYFGWMENVRDWCISRQLWWGHRIPAWTCGDCGHLAVARETPTTCPACGGAALTQDEDVLDTWFSSALWPFSTLGWPEKTDDLAKFYPTTVMETGFDIIFFWVARMIFMGLHFMGEVPFSTVFLHAMVRDKNGEKMSKTRGNVIDPLHIVDGIRPEQVPADERQQYEQLLQDFPDGIAPQGADALRFTLAVYAAAGRDIKLDVKRVEGYRAFINKLWNSARFAQANLADYAPRALDPSHEALSPADEWILTRLARVTEATTGALDEFRFSDAAQGLYEFVWHEVCDWYLELAKPMLYGDAPPVPGDRAGAQATLATVLDTVLRLLHPFIPFVTEELWAALPKPPTTSPALVVSTWPDAASLPRFAASADSVTLVTEVITAIRRVRGESNVPPSATFPKVMLLTDDATRRDALRACAPYIMRQAKVAELQIDELSVARPDKAATTVQSGVEIAIPLEGLVDLEAERTRLEKELAKTLKDIEFFERKLSNASFVANAPPDVVASDTAKLEAAREKRGALEAGLARL
ncbi:MAG: valine--tRNA ligase [Myxococcales bacterium]|nr:valine--tRNA ligase [Myxococcales bacterium]MCB9519350.1 valine--tRNA ligase [Myxococcales bacterium]